MRGTFTHANPDFLKDIQQHARPRLHGAEHGTGRLRTGRPLRADRRRTSVIVMEQYEKLG